MKTQTSTDNLAQTTQELRTNINQELAGIKAELAGIKMRLDKLAHIESEDIPILYAHIEKLETRFNRLEYDLAAIEK